MVLRRWLLWLLCILGSSCSEPRCPDGFDQIGNSCRRQQAEGGAMEPAVVDSSDAADVAEADGGSAPSWMLDSAAAADAAPAIDASTPSNPDDAASTNGDAQTPIAECDDQRHCSAGYSCEGGRCVSACERTQCDANATCSLMGSSPVCTCNSGFIAQGKACIRDLACEELGCSRNAACEVGSDALRRCVCKNGYVGDGKACEPVRCPAAAELSIPNGSVVTPNGATFGQSALYTCNAGYRIATGDAVRACEDHGGVGTWSGAAPTCLLSCAIDHSCRLGEACLSDPNCGSGNVCANGKCLVDACAGGEFTSADSLRNCRSVNGDLKIRLTASGAATLEFPSITEVAGNLSIAATEVIPSKRVVSFGGLTRVGGGLDIGPAVAGDIVGLSAIEVSLPKLARVELNIRVMLAQTLRLLSMPALTNVGGDLYLQYLDYLQTLRLDALQSVNSQLYVLLLPNVGMSPTFTRLAGVLGSKLTTLGVGCCFPTNGSADCASRPQPTTCL